jgi:5-methylcytosine-specific restriction endonuclease McrA
MRPGKPADPERQARIRAEMERDRAAREKSYRERALGLFPHVCARCGRAFTGKRLRELTVHHRDHDHRNNPLDGSNWELLCLYCHDHEHEKHRLAGHYEEGRPGEERPPPSTFQAFEGLDALLTLKKGEGTPGKKGA